VTRVIEDRKRAMLPGCMRRSVLTTVVLECDERLERTQLQFNLHVSCRSSSAFRQVTDVI